MIASATRRADALGLRNVDFRQMASERLEYGDATFDSVSNVYGLMFSPDPAEALREAKRVLKPGGRVAVVVWDEFEKSPFFTAITDVARRVLGLATPEPGGPGPFRFARAGAVDDVLHKAGFSRCRTDTVDAVFEFASADEYLQVFRDVAWKSRVDALSPDALAAFRRSVADATRSYDVDGHLRLGASSLGVVAEK